MIAIFKRIFYKINFIELFRFDHVPVQSGKSPQRKRKHIRIMPVFNEKKHGENLHLK